MPRLRLRAILHFSADPPHPPIFIRIWLRRRTLIVDSNLMLIYP